MMSVAQVIAPQLILEDLALADPRAATQLKPRARPPAPAGVRPRTRPERSRRSARRIARFERPGPGEHDERAVAAPHRGPPDEAGLLKATHMVSRDTFAASHYGRQRVHRRGADTPSQASADIEQL